jgi:hypothetical protein
MDIGSPSGSLAEGAVNRVAVREVFVDFFGSLIPGMVFLLTALTTLGASLLAAKLIFVFQMTRDGSISGGMQSIEQAAKIVHAFQLAWISLLVMGSYVVGYAFYRRDLRAADQRSFARLFPTPRLRAPWLARGWGRLVPRPVREFWNRRPHRVRQRERQGRAQEDLKHWVARDKGECEFPYPHMREYLNVRGLRHLARMISWGEGSGATPLQTKNFINILKIRLAFFHPDKCAGISRNEAHVRLLGSTWYMSQKMKYPGWVAFAASALSIGFAVPNDFIRRLPGVFAYAVFSLVLAGTVLLVSFLTTRAIEKSLHYQRVQEIVWVLETAYSAFRSEPHRLLDLCPHFLTTYDSGIPDEDQASAPLLHVSEMGGGIVREAAAEAPLVPAGE